MAGWSSRSTSCAAASATRCWRSGDVASRRSAHRRGAGGDRRQPDLIVVAPSNPFVSVGTILAVPGHARRAAARAAPVVAVSPVVGGKALRGPADRMLESLGGKALGGRRRGALREHYPGLVDAFVLDDADTAKAMALRASGVAIDTARHGDAHRRRPRATGQRDPRGTPSRLTSSSLRLPCARPMPTDRSAPPHHSRAHPCGPADAHRLGRQGSAGRRPRRRGARGAGAGHARAHARGARASGRSVGASTWSVPDPVLDAVTRRAGAEVSVHRQDGEGLNEGIRWASAPPASRVPPACWSCQATCRTSRSRRSTSWSWRPTRR